MMSEKVQKTLNDLEKAFNRSYEGDFNEDYYKALKAYIDSYFEDVWK